VLTGDTPVVGRKRRDRTESVVSDAQVLANIGPLADMSLVGQAANVTFADIGWLARLGVPVLVKGVLRPDDARACIDAGAAGVIVSNHGGRQLDRALPTALALPGVTAELARAPEGAPPGDVGRVYVDGGLRTGEDVLTALGLGAHAVFLGRPVLWALACDGADGVRDLLTGMTADLAHVMALAGARTLSDLAGVTGSTTAHSLDT
jgi:4-hydroxymandelate oxidase